MRALFIVASAALLIAGPVGCDIFDDDDDDRDLLCPALEPMACLESAVCTLELAAASQSSAVEYSCRAARGYCETGFRQIIDNRDVCDSRAGCDYITEPCFCPPDPRILCLCSGGAPPTCIPG